jgi:hypothetical protein
MCTSSLVFLNETLLHDVINTLLIQSSFSFVFLKTQKPTQWAGFAIGFSVTLSGKDRATILITGSQPPSTLKRPGYA